MKKTLAGLLITFCIILIPDSHALGSHALIQLSSFINGRIDLYSASAFGGIAGLFICFIEKLRKPIMISLLLVSEFLLTLSLFKFIHWHDWFIPFASAVPFFIFCIFSWYKLIIRIKG